MTELLEEKIEDMFVELIPQLNNDPMSYFNGDTRECQAAFIKWLAENINKYDVIVGNLPTGAGKSKLAEWAMEWMLKEFKNTTATVVPTVMLQDQYTDDMPEIPMLKGASRYMCACHPGSTCERTKATISAYCSDEHFKDNKREIPSNATPIETSQGPKLLVCPYEVARYDAINSPKAFFNVHSMIFNRAQKTNLIFDEGHNVEEILSSMFTIKLWKCEDNYSDDIQNVKPFQGIGGKVSQEVNKKDVAEWLADFLSIMATELQTLKAQNMLKQAETLTKKIDQYKQILDILVVSPADVLAIRKFDEYRGTREDCQQFKHTQQEMLYIRPLDVSTAYNRLVNGPGINKTMFFSATIGEYDIEALGLDTKRVGYFKGESPIPVENRLLKYIPVGSMRFRSRKETIPKMIKWVEKLAKHHADEKGVVHVTYALNKALRETYFPPEVANRMMFHTTRDKLDVLNRFKNTKQPKILIASGLSEGLDLPGDQCRWQVLMMVNKPNIQDEVNFYNLKYNRRKYFIKVARTIMQQVGRSNRGATDKSTCYILDTEFEEVWNMKGLWEDWFIPCVKFPKKK